MVLSINIPENVKSIFNSMKQLNKNRTLFDLESKVNQIYYSELNIIYGSELIESSIPINILVVEFIALISTGRILA